MPNAVVASRTFPADWRETTPGLRWRGVDLPYHEVSPDLVVTEAAPQALAWVVVRIDLARVRLAVARSPEHDLASMADDPTVLAAVDGGYFEPDFSPSGLLVSGGTQLRPLHPRAGTGVLVVTGGQASVWTSEGFDAGAPAVDALEVQCGPRLVEQGGVPGIRRDDGRRYARTAACVRDGGRTLDLVTTWDPSRPMRGPGLFQFARMLAGPSPVGDAGGCNVALNLDGGPSTGVYVEGGFRHNAVGPTPWLIVARRAHGLAGR